MDRHVGEDVFDCAIDGGERSGPDRVDWAPARWAGALEFNVEIAALNSGVSAYFERRVIDAVAVHIARKNVSAVRDGRDMRAHTLFRPVLERLDGLADYGLAVFFEQCC